MRRLLALPSQGPTLAGEVLEVKDVDQYTCLRLKTSMGEAWAAVARGTVRTDVDLGSGYSNKALIDGAALQK